MFTYYSITQTPGENPCNSVIAGGHKKTITQGDRENNSHWGNGGGSFAQLPSKCSSASISQGLLVLVFFPFNPLDFPVFIPIFLQVFSPHRVIGWVIWHTGSWPQSLPRTEPPFQETPPPSQWRRMTEKGQRVRTWQVQTAYPDSGAQADICSQKNKFHQLDPVHP